MRWGQATRKGHQYISAHYKLKEMERWAGPTAQRLRGLAALAENPNVAPSLHMAAHNLL